MPIRLGMTRIRKKYAKYLFKLLSTCVSPTLPSLGVTESHIYRNTVVFRVFPHLLLNAFQIPWKALPSIPAYPLEMSHWYWKARPLHTTSTFALASVLALCGNISKLPISVKPGACEISLMLPLMTSFINVVWSHAVLMLCFAEAVKSPIWLVPSPADCQVPSTEQWHSMFSAAVLKTDSLTFGTPH